GTQVDHVEARHVRAYLKKPKKNKEPRAAATLEIYLARIQTFFSWCQEKGWRRGKNPAERVTTPKVGKKVPLFLSRKEYDAILKTIEAVAEEKGKKKRAEKRG